MTSADTGDDPVPIPIGRRIDDLRHTQPDRVALVHVAEDATERSLTWRDLADGSARVAHGLRARGVAHGDRVGLGVRNSPELVVAALAVWRLGAVPVPVRWDVPEWELHRVLEVIEPRVHLGEADVGWLRSLVDGDDVPDLPSDVFPPNLQGICSSGSTGTPKVILMERPGLFDATFGAPLLESWRPVPRPQTVLVLAPMYHTNGFATLLSLLAGDRLVVLERFAAAAALDAIERHRVTTFTATPTMLQRMVDLPGIDDRDLSSLEWILQGAAMMPASLVHRWAGLIGADRIVMAYGMTEGLGLTAIRGDEWMTHPGSVGRGIRETEIRVLDADGADLPPGGIGEVHLRSAMAHGYRYLGGAPLLPGTDDGFETAGDLGFLDDDGYLYLVDRRVDVIITGGANVYPAEVEAALIDHPAIADVVVVGLRDPEWGRRVHAIVEPADPAAPPTAEEVIATAKTRLAGYKVPKTIELVDAIPRSEATKINRRALVDARGG